jgi:di/tricarboxylate transporter
MNWQAWVTLAVVVATVVTLAKELVPPAVAVLGAAVVLLLAGIIDAEQAFAGFSNEAPITVAALFIVARAVEGSGLLGPAVERLIGGSSGPRAQLARIIAPTAAASAVLNNTPIVAMVAPQVSEWASRRELAASRYLMPISYAAILGGVVTLIGTSTNIVVSGLLAETGRPPLGMFELTAVGLPVALAGLAVIIALAGRLLPDRRTPRDALVDSGRAFTVSMRVLPGGQLDGTTVEEGELRQLHGVYCVQVERDGRRIAPVAPTQMLEAGDVLTFVGKVDDIVDLQSRRGLTSTEEQQVRSLQTDDRSFFEAVIGPESPLVGQTLKSADFRSRYQAAVLAIHRAGAAVDAKLGEVELRPGDTLLLLADRAFRTRWRETREFLLIARLGTAPPDTNRSAPAAVLITLGLVVAAGAGVLPILNAALAAVALLLLVRAVSFREARNAVDIDILIVIAAAFGLGAAVSESGLADGIARLLLAVFAPLGAVGALAGILLATMALTEAISNNAAAVLMFPIALSTAAAVGADARPFAVAVALGASLSFLTPIGYQTNLMVYGLGGYRFGDYARLGAPLNVVVVTIALLIIPRVWPL